MTAFDTKCAWLPCRKPLGVLVYRLTKLSTRQFCCETCAEKWATMERMNKATAQTYARVAPRHLLHPPRA